MVGEKPRGTRVPRWWRSVALAALTTLSIGFVHAQDAFEIHVLEYEELAPGEFTYENHFNYVASGTDGTDSNVLHETNELTGGIAQNVSLGVMQLNAGATGGILGAAGWRIVPHFYTPRRWHLPVRLGLVTEIAFERPAWSADTHSIEIVPIIEKQIGPIKLDINPSIGRALHGPGVDRGWGFGLAGRIAAPAVGRLTPAIEYYSDLGQLPTFSPLAHQGHQIVPGGDIRLSKHLLWSVGLGVGLSPATNSFVVKSRLEYSFKVHKSSD